MKLKSSIFLWVSLSTVLPLTALILGLTAYSEHLYRNNVDNTISSSMKNIVSELDFRLNYERDVMLSLASSPAMKRFFPTLQAASDGDLLPNYFDEVDKLNEFLEGFQHSVPGIDTVRVLDYDGNTLVKVRFGKHLPAMFESMEDVPFAEEELTDDDFLHWMQQLKPYQLTYGELPLSQRDYVQGEEGSLLNAIIPVANHNQRTIGFMTARSTGDQLDHILVTLPRSFNYKISIAELNENNPSRNGMLLYSDTFHILFNQGHKPENTLANKISHNLWVKLQKTRFGSYLYGDQDNRFYYQEFYPYSNQLISWVVIIQLQNSEISAPFQRIRIGLLIFALLALGISLILANVGAMKIARPITAFSESLKRYADGERNLDTSTDLASEELRELNQSFHYLTDTLHKTEEQRNQAEKLLLQNAKLASIGEMAAGIGHELNNPLNNILSYTKLIERENPDPEPAMAEDLEGLRSEALRAGRIVKGILNFARQVPPEYNQFDLTTWLNDTLLLIAPEAHKYRVFVELGDIPEVDLEGDRNQLQQVMVNLLINAIQVSEDNQVVQINVSLPDADHVRIVISDEGTGIDDKTRDKIFDPFFSTKSVGEGSGLGLSISLGIIQYHNGSLTLENNERGGVDAIILLPLGRNHD